VQVQVLGRGPGPGASVSFCGGFLGAKYKCLLPIRDAPGKLEEDD
jgi:hypothetical protein